MLFPTPMKFLFRWFFRIVVLTLLLGVALLLLKNILLTELAQQGVAKRTGLEVRIDRVQVGVLKPTVTVEGLRLYNPAEFGGGPFLDFREIHVEYDPGALLRGRLWLRLLRLDLEELCVVRAEGDRWNFQTINERIQERAPRQRRVSVAFGGIGVLNLSVGRIRQFAMEAPDRVHVQPIHLRDEVFTGLRTPADYIRVAGRLAWKLGVRTWSGSAAESTGPGPTR